MSNNPFDAPPSSGAALRPEVVKGKLTPVGIALIVAGVLSALTSLYWAFNGGVLLLSGDQIMEQMDAAQREQMEQAAEQGVDPMMIFGTAAIGFLVWGIVGILASMLVVWGGICALRMKGRKMAMTASILSAIPFVFQPCCLSIPIGIWGLVVLMAPDVKAAFDRQL